MNLPSVLVRTDPPTVQPAAEQLGPTTQLVTVEQPAPAAETSATLRPDPPQPQRSDIVAAQQRAGASRPPQRSTPRTMSVSNRDRAHNPDTDLRSGYSSGSSVSSSVYAGEVERNRQLRAQQDIMAQRIAELEERAKHNTAAFASAAAPVAAPAEMDRIISFTLPLDYEVADHDQLKRIIRTALMHRDVPCAATADIQLTKGSISVAIVLPQREADIVHDVLEEFTEAANGKGAISLAAFTECFDAIVDVSQMSATESHSFHRLLERLYTLFDSDGDGTVDVTELSAGLSVLCGGSRDEKVRSSVLLFALLFCLLTYSFVCLRRRARSSTSSTRTATASCRGRR